LSDSATVTATKWALRLPPTVTTLPDENYERDWANRFHVDDLYTIGRRGLGLDD
jgi:hypothetical protein